MNPITELHQTIDRLNEKLARATAANGRPVTCQGAGCCACCREPVYCSSEEAAHIVAGLTQEQRDAVVVRLKASLDKAWESGLMGQKLPSVVQWIALDLPCPLLESGRCIVYERRPVGCRIHMATGPYTDCLHNREEQVYVTAKEHSEAYGTAILIAALKSGNIIHHDNLLALLENELLGEYRETASAQMIMIEEPDNQERTETK